MMNSMIQIWYSKCYYIFPINLMKVRTKLAICAVLFSRSIEPQANTSSET